MRQLFLSKPIIIVVICLWIGVMLTGLLLTFANLNDFIDYAYYGKVDYAGDDKAMTYSYFQQGLALLGLDILLTVILFYLIKQYRQRLSH